jgi:hypothetical protein
MDPAVFAIFERLRFPQQEVQWDAVVEIVMLLERALKLPQSDEEICAACMTAEALALDLSRGDIDEVIDEMVDHLKSETLLRDTKPSLFWSAMKFADLRHADGLLQFFDDRAPTFTEQEAFSSIAGLTLFGMRCEDDLPALRKVAEKHGTVELFESFRSHTSARVREAVGRALRCF